MLVFVASSSLFSFLLLLLTTAGKPLPPWLSEMKLLSLLLCQEFLHHSLHCLASYRSLKRLPSAAAMLFALPKLDGAVVVEPPQPEEDDPHPGMTVLDLPELALDMVLDRLAPAELLSMAAVCKPMKDRCRSDRLWERHFREKWGRLLGPAARRQWEADSVSPNNANNRNKNKSKQNGLSMTSWILESLSCVWPCSWFMAKGDGEGSLVTDDGSGSGSGSDSVMARYLALESGRLWFPGQVYNREQNGHVGFLLSCYDAELCYDSQTDTFHARYPPHGQRGINVEERVQWERLRAPPVETPAHDLHASDCLTKLRPGDHIEIQWRRNKEFPYGWWYGVVGHLESCDGEEHHCRCYHSDTVVLEFNQYSVGSRWRRTVVDRKDHKEEGNESDGFYGGIRKLRNQDEISTWRRLWPTEVLE